MNKKDVMKVLKTKDKLENEMLETDQGFDVGDFSMDEWVDMVCEKLKIKQGGKIMKYLGKFEKEEEAEEFKKDKKAFIKKQTYTADKVVKTFWYVYSKKE